MNSIFVPKKINVGFQERSGTYTGKLAYIIYFDEKGVLRKEKSWESWRSKKIDNEICENVPTEGFVLNKKVGGYSTGWNHRQSYCRVYDPRGFEFEITLDNLLYILENTNSIKGKGLEGEFVYGWDGKDLVLIPTDSPDYKEIEKLNVLRHAQEFVKAKELKIGATYLTKSNDELIYMGRFDYYGYRGNKKNQFFFCDDKEGNNFTAMASISKKFVSTVSEECVDNYAELMDKLESKEMYSPYDPTKDEYVPYNLEDFIGKVKASYWGVTFYNDNHERMEVCKSHKDSTKHYIRGYNQYIRSSDEKPMSLEEIFEIIKPMYKNKYLKNGRFHRREY
jgi:hypothetical protein